MPKTTSRCVSISDACQRPIAATATRSGHNPGVRGMGSRVAVNGSTRPLPHMSSHSTVKHVSSDLPPGSTVRARDELFC
eukprot:360479-Chlamydomonas_euryale.AAC.3